MFFSYPNNKKELISFLSTSFKADSEDVFVCKVDTNSKIASTALELAKENQVVVVADDKHNVDLVISKSISCLYMHGQAVTQLQLPLVKENQLS